MSNTEMKLSKFWKNSIQMAMERLVRLSNVDFMRCSKYSSDYTEFIAASIDHKLYEQEAVCNAAFRVFDLDGDGKITMSV